MGSGLFSRCWLSSLSGASERVKALLPSAVIGLGCYKRDRRSGAMFLVTSFLVDLSLNLAFAAWAHHNGHFYQPMHVFHRGASGAGLISRLAMPVLLGASVVWVFRKMGTDAASWCVEHFL